MEIVSTLTKKACKDISGYWVDRDILGTIYAFVREGTLDQASIDANTSFDWGVFLLD